MKQPLDPSARRARIVFWITGVACVGCCAVPLAGIAFGAAAVAGLAAWAEPIALVVGWAGLVAYAGWRWSRRGGPQCDIDTPRRAAGPDDR